MNNDLTKRAMVAACVVAAGAAVAVGQTRYVNANLTTGANDGSSWANAHRGSLGLANAIAATNSGEIWVAAGRYVPAAVGTRTASFGIKPNVAIYGGFVGNEASRAARDWRTNITTLSGDLSGNDAAWPSTTNRGENSYHVVALSGTGQNGILDGFVISGGFADDNTANLDRDRGGGIILLGNNALTSGFPRFINVTIRENRTNFGGGAIYARQADARFENVLIERNNGGFFGGAMDAFNACDIGFSQAIIRNNTALRAGGLEAFGNVSLSVVNSLLHSNTATGTSTSANGTSGGGGIYANSSSVNLRNVTIADNAAQGLGGGGILAAAGSTVTARSSIIHSNTGPGAATSGQQTTSTGTPASTYTILYSNVQGITPGTNGNINAVPGFVASASGNYRLLATSPCVDAGDAQTAGQTSLDLDGNARLVNAPLAPNTGLAGVGFFTGLYVDMGAYEFQGCPADVAGPNQSTTPDGVATADDIIVFLNWFFASTTGNVNSPSNLKADIAGANQSTTPDGTLTADDIIVYFGRYFVGC
jgi:hypothetical protein